MLRSSSLLTRSLAGIAGALALLCAASPAAAQVVFTPHAWNAWPNDDVDDTAALGYCINDIKNYLNATGQKGILQLDAGTYRISNTLHMEDVGTGLTIQGSTTPGTRTTLLSTNPTTGILWAHRSRDVTVAHLDVDYNPLPFTQGTISNYNAANHTFTFTAPYRSARSGTQGSWRHPPRRPAAPAPPCD